MEGKGEPQETLEWAMAGGCPGRERARQEGHKQGLHFAQTPSPFPFLYPNADSAPILSSVKRKQF